MGFCGQCVHEGFVSSAEFEQVEHWVVLNRVRLAYIVAYVKLERNSNRIGF